MMIEQANEVAIEVSFGEVLGIPVDEEAQNASQPICRGIRSKIIS